MDATEAEPATHRANCRVGRLLLLALAALVAGGRSAAALESTPVSSVRDSVTLVSDTDAITPGAPFRIGLRIRLAPGWHTYWQNPGDAGVAPDLKLNLPVGVAAGPIEWPAPQRITEGSLVTYAYTGDVLLPLTVAPSASAAPIPIEASATWLVCKQICVPEEGRFRLDLPTGDAAPSPQAPLFASADAARPITAPWPAHIAPDGQLRVEGAGLGPATVATAWFFPATAGTIDDAAPQRLEVRPGGIVLKLTGVKPGTRLSGVLAIADRAGHRTSFSLNASPGPVPVGASQPLIRLLGAAFLGGLILNLMPCVFPVLAMKAMGLAEGAARGRMRPLALSYALGVMVTFGALGGALMAAQAAGDAAGWGFQFQSPAFVAGMAWVLLAVGLNLSGVFELSHGLGGKRQGLAARGGHLGSFFTGLLAVLVATPCTAPFMAVAIGGALAAASGAVTLMVFLAMGAGLAIPYVLLAELPWLTRLLPRPGRWMEVLRQALAFPMYAAAVWLVWVISQEVGPVGVLGVLAGALLIGFGAWVLGATQTGVDKTRRLGQSIAAAAVLAAVAVLSAIAGAPPAPAASLMEAGAETFTPARLAALRAAGRPVFVDMTAAWCVTCLINERVAIATPAVQRAFAEHDVTHLVGDWTRQDPAITDFLRRNGRAGVPLYMYFPPGRGDGIVLPQILTEATMLARVNAGRGS